MKTWIKGEVSHALAAGIFRLNVWPVRGDGPFQGWAVIPEDGDSNVLPSKGGFATADEAKEWIEDAFTDCMREALGWQDESRTITSVEQVYATRYDCMAVPG